MQDEQPEEFSKKAKSHKGRKILTAREAKLEEGPRKTLFLKSTKTSDSISKLSHDLYSLKKHNSLAVNKRYDIRPFEKSSEIEFLCKKYDCPLFSFVYNFIRPNNLAIGRIYENQILDMVEFGIEDLTSQAEFLNKINIPMNARPCVIFQGDLFEFDANYIKMKNLLLDFFVENIEVSRFNILNFSHLVSFTLEKENVICLKVYGIQINSVGDENKEKFKLEEIGPSCKLLVRRHQFANDDLYKLACKQPKLDKKLNKNIKTDKMGDKKGRLFVERQNIDAIAMKKRKKLKTEKIGKKKTNMDQMETELNEEVE